MLDVSLFETHMVDYRIPGLSKPVTLIPFGDIHWDSSNCARDVFDDWCAWAKAQKDALFIGMGDYFDFLSSSERRAINEHTVHDTTVLTIEQAQQHEVDRFVRKTAFMRGRLIGLIEGNHHGVFSDGTTTTQRMIVGYNYQRKGGKLVPVKGPVRAKYLGVLAAIRLRLYAAKKGVMYPVDIIAFHGRSRAQTKGGSLNAVAKQALTADANIYLAGHNHGLESGKDQRLKLESLRNKLYVKHREIAYVRTGSFLKSYVPGKSSYVVPKVLPPAVLGAPYLQLTLRRRRDPLSGSSPLMLEIKVTI